MTVRLLMLALLAFAGTVVAVDAVRPQAPALVHVDVTVVDRAGQPVSGLGPADFEVLSGGEPIEPAAFTPVEIPIPPDGGARPADGQLAPRHVPFDVLRNDDLVDRYVVVVIDDLRSGDEPGARWVATSGLDIARTVVGHLTPADRGAVFFSWLGQRQGLTGSRDRLLRALDEFATRPAGASDCAPADCLVDTLQAAVDVLPVTPVRRKVVVYISGNTPLPVIAPPGTAPAASTALGRLTYSLQETNTVVYSITAPGVTPATEAGDLSLAEATGGRALVDTMPAQQIESLFREAGSYYLLSVPAPETGARPLTIRAVRDDLQVRARAGVLAPVADETSVPPGLTPLEAAMVAPRAEASLPLGVSVAPFASPRSGQAVVTVVSAVTGARAGGAESWQAEVAATAFDTSWQPRASSRQTIEVTPRGANRTQTVDVIAGLELLPGRYQVRVAAESGGRAGTVFVDLEIPSFDSAPLSASGAVLTTMPVPYAASPVVAEALPVTPTTRRLFQSSEAVEVFLRIYQADRPRPVSVAVRIGDAEGEGIIQGDEVVPAAAFDGSGATDWRFALPLDRLAPGEYLLTVGVSLDGQTVTRYVRFAVMAPVSTGRTPAGADSADRLARVEGAALLP